LTHLLTDKYSRAGVHPKIYIEATEAIFILIIIFIILMYVFWIKHDKCYNLCDPHIVVFMNSLCTDKNKIKFSSYIRKFRWDQFAKSFMRKGFLIYEEMRKYLLIYEEADSHM
jgi:hypothetical protein